MILQSSDGTHIDVEGKHSISWATPNTLEYPLDYWAIKLYDTWVRDHLSTLDDPFYGLTEVPIVAKDTIFYNILPKGMYATGSYALYLAGHMRKGTHDFLHDVIDIRITDPEQLHKYVEKSDLEMRMGCYCTPSSLYGFGMTEFMKHYGFRPLYETRICTRKYPSITAIAHDMDIDCCGFILSYDDGTPRLYATKIALYAVQHMVNWLDPKRMSMSYAYGIAKYVSRGYKLMLPLFPVQHDDPILRSRIDAIIDATNKAYDKELNIIPDPDVRERLLKRFDEKDTPFYNLGIISVYTAHLYSEIGALKEYTSLIHTDEASIVILASMSSLCIPSRDEYDLVMPRTPVKDLKAWYMSSPLLAIQ